MRATCNWILRISIKLIYNPFPVLLYHHPKFMQVSEESVMK